MVTKRVDVDGLEAEDGGPAEADAEEAAPAGRLGGECGAGAGLDGAGGGAVGQGDGGPERSGCGRRPAGGFGGEGEACGGGRCCRAAAASAAAKAGGWEAGVGEARKVAAGKRRRPWRPETEAAAGGCAWRVSRRRWHRGSAGVLKETFLASSSVFSVVPLNSLFVQLKKIVGVNLLNDAFKRFFF